VTKGGGYDDGYSRCSCFWGTEPSTLVVRLLNSLPNLLDLDVLDAGCGEGKNAVAFAKRGARVTGVDCSSLALRNGQKMWPQARIRWINDDLLYYSLGVATFDVVVAYGLLHCLRTQQEVGDLVRKLQQATRRGGWNAVCAFNARRHDLAGHVGFEPCLLSHQWYVDRYHGWEVEVCP
jgi:tellurite methyltransferase